MNNSTSKTKAGAPISPTQENVTRTYPEAVFDMAGKRVPAGVKVTLPRPTARRFEARWSLKSVPVDKT